MCPCDTAPMDTHCARTPGLPAPGLPEARIVARGDPPEGEAVRRPCGPEEDGVVCASHWRGFLEQAIEEEEDDDDVSRNDFSICLYVQCFRGCLVLTTHTSSRNDIEAMMPQRAIAQAYFPFWAEIQYQS